MSDFLQTGVVATFHRIGTNNLDKIESELLWYALEGPIEAFLNPGSFGKNETLFALLEDDLWK